MLNDVKAMATQTLEHLYRFILWEPCWGGGGGGGQTNCPLNRFTI